MRQWRLAAGTSRNKTSLPVPLSAPQAYLPPLGPERISGLRQVEEFSAKLDKLRRAAYLSGGLLLLLTGSCVYLFLQNVDIVALFSSGAVVMLIQIVFAAGDYYREERRAAEAYRRYLDNYSYQVIRALRQTSALSEWSRQELDNYLAAPHIKW